MKYKMCEHCSTELKKTEYAVRRMRRILSEIIWLTNDNDWPGNIIESFGKAVDLINSALFEYHLKHEDK